MCAGRSPSQRVAQAAQVVKGCDEVLAPVAELDRQNRQGYELSRQGLERGRRLILADPKGIEPAVALARELVSQAPTSDYASPLRQASASP